MNISDRLKEQMKIRKISVPGLSEKTGISENTIKNYLYRGQEPRAEAMLAIANALDISAAYLRGESDDPTRPIWESSSTLDELKKIDVSLLPGLLESYQQASPETQFYVRGALAYIANALHVEDAEFQRRTTHLLEHFCNIAYDFSRNYQQEARRGEEGQKIDFAKAYNFYIERRSGGYPTILLPLQPRSASQR